MCHCKDNRDSGDHCNSECALRIYREENSGELKYCMILY